MKEKVIALVDGNNFFVGCEIFKNPSLEGKPVCVLSNNDGCVIARSNEAKKIGITMGMPYFIAKRNFPNAVFLSSDYVTYHDLSERMMTFLSKYSDKIDVYSVDEAFLDITGVDRVFNLDYESLAKKIKSDIQREVGISVSVGISNSKILAKTAVHKAKSRSGTYVIGKNMIKEELQNIPVNDIWGVGKNIAERLKRFGIFYADEILLQDDEFFKKNFGKKGLELKYELSGISVIPLTGEAVQPKSVQRTRAFPEFSSDRDYIKTELNMHLHNVCKKLRACKLETDIIGVMLRTKNFKVFYAQEKLEKTSDSEIELFPLVKKLFESIFSEEIIYRASGIYAGDLKSQTLYQLNFFNDNSDKKIKSVSSVLDKLENKFGRGAVALGSGGIKSVRDKHKRIMNCKS